MMRAGGGSSWETGQQVQGAEVGMRVNLSEGFRRATHSPDTFSRLLCLLAPSVPLLPLSKHWG